MTDKHRKVKIDYSVQHYDKMEFIEDFKKAMDK